MKGSVVKGDTRGREKGVTTSSEERDEPCLLLDLRADLRDLDLECFVIRSLFKVGQLNH